MIPGPMKPTTAIVGLALIGIALLGGCDFESSETKGEDVAQEWIDAVAAGDTDTACSLMAEREGSKPPWPRYCPTVYFPPKSEMKSGFSEAEIVSVRRPDRGSEVLVLVTGLKGGFGTPLTKKQAEELGLGAEYEDLRPGGAKANPNAAIISTAPYDDEYKVRFTSSFG